MKNINSSTSVALVLACTLLPALFSTSAAAAQTPTAKSQPASGSTTTTVPASYKRHCASCHGADRRGKIGVPNLADKIWIWGGDVASIETTIRHGIRSSDPQTRSGVMAGFKHNDAELSDANIIDLIEYLQMLAGKKSDAAAVERAKENWVWCVDCHGAKGEGKPDIGAPNLVDGDWLYGGNRKSIAISIGEGRKGVCPGGAGQSGKNKMDEKSIHSLAVWLAGSTH